QVAAVVAEEGRSDRMEWPLRLLAMESRPGADVADRRGAEGGEVAADEQPAAGFLVGAVRADPVLRECIEVGAATIPGARRRYAHEVEVRRQPVVVAYLGDHVVGAARPVGERPAKLSIRGRRSRPRRPGTDAPKPPLVAGAHCRAPGPEVTARDDVDGAAQDRRLHERPAFQRPSHLLAREPVEA